MCNLDVPYLPMGKHMGTQKTVTRLDDTCSHEKARKDPKYEMTGTMGSKSLKSYVKCYMYLLIH